MPGKKTERNRKQAKGRDVLRPLIRDGSFEQELEWKSISEKK
jgi:hypothetical protein